jgi:dihydroneopterin aldolase
LLKSTENDLKSIVNYENIISQIKSITQDKHYNLLETLAEDIFTHLFLSVNIIKIKLRIEKPEIIKNTSSVGIEITKKRK